MTGKKSSSSVESSNNLTAENFEGIELPSLGQTKQLITNARKEMLANHGSKAHSQDSSSENLSELNKKFEKFKNSPSSQNKQDNVQQDLKALAAVEEGLELFDQSNILNALAPGVDISKNPQLINEIDSKKLDKSTQKFEEFLHKFQSQLNDPKNKSLRLLGIVAASLLIVSLAVKIVLLTGIPGLVFAKVAAGKPLDKIATQITNQLNTWVKDTLTKYFDKEGEGDKFVVALKEKLNYGLNLLKTWLFDSKANATATYRDQLVGHSQNNEEAKNSPDNSKNVP